MAGTEVMGEVVADTVAADMAVVATVVEVTEVGAMAQEAQAD